MSTPPSRWLCVYLIGSDAKWSIDCREAEQLLTAWGGFIGASRGQMQDKVMELRNVSGSLVHLALLSIESIEEETVETLEESCAFDARENRIRNEANDYDGPR